jgi:hypothetical protein
MNIKICRCSLFPSWPGLGLPAPLYFTNGCKILDRGWHQIDTYNCSWLPQHCDMNALFEVEKSQQTVTSAWAGMPRECPTSSGSAVQFNTCWSVGTQREGWGVDGVGAGWRGAGIGGRGEPARQPENVTLLVKSETKGSQKQLFTSCLITKM